MGLVVPRVVVPRLVVLSPLRLYLGSHEPRKKDIAFAGSSHKLHFQIPYVFPVQSQIPCSYSKYLFRFHMQNCCHRPIVPENKLDIFETKIEIFFVLRIRESNACVYKVPVFWQNSCAFPDCLFPVPWRHCISVCESIVTWRFSQMDLHDCYHRRV